VGGSVLVRGCRSPTTAATCDLDDLTGWLAFRTDQTAMTRLLRIGWETGGRIVEHVGEELVPADRLDDLVEISLDSVKAARSVADGPPLPHTRTLLAELPGVVHETVSRNGPSAAPGLTFRPTVG
jgi:hypothetical protein